jgi:hypothetical protein
LNNISFTTAGEVIVALKDGSEFLLNTFLEDTPIKSGTQNITVVEAGSSAAEL